MNSRNIKVLGYGKLTVATNSYALEELVMNGRMGMNFGIAACPAVIRDLGERGPGCVVRPFKLYGSIMCRHFAFTPIARQIGYLLLDVVTC